MKRTLLSALKHSSGILLTIFALLCSCQVWADDARGKTIYLEVVDEWAGAAAKYCLYCFNAEHSTGGFVEMTQVSSTNFYYATVPSNIIGYVCDKVIFVRSNPSGFTECSFSTNWWGQTNDLIYDEDYNLCKVGDDGSGEGGGRRYNGTWSYTREFSEGEYIYLKNIVPTGWGSACWINTTDATYAYLYTYGGTAGTHTYRFTLVPGTGSEGAVDAVYGARITTAGTYTSFKVTRGGTACEDGSEPTALNKTSEINYPESYNYMNGGYTANSSSVNWDNFTPCTVPSVTTTSSPSTTAVSASCAGTYSYGGDYCVPASVGIAYKAAGGEYADHEGTASSGAITASLTGLVPGTTYTYKAYVVLDNNTRIEGSEQTFTTGCPTISISSGPSTSDVSYCDGSVVAALAVTATSYPDYTMEYQWYSSADKSDDDIISGATESTYTPSSGTLYYRCKVRTNSACDSSAETSNYSGQITFDPAKVSPVITVSASSVTNYTPVTLTASKAVIETWALSGSGLNQYLYKKTGTSAVFKGNVGSGSAVVYTITGTTSNACSSAVNITVNSDVDICQ